MSEQSDLWDRIFNCADSLERFEKGTRNKWRERGCVPYEHHYDLVQAGKEIGVSLSHVELRALNDRVKKQRASKALITTNHTTGHEGVGAP